jgi:preprotein translocase subunit YajC
LANTTQADKPISDKLYKAEYVGSGTFIISKPKRKKTKQRQSNLKNVRRGSRK